MGSWPIDDILCVVPESLTGSFSYVAEHVSDDGAITILERLMDVTRHIREEGHVAGAWDAHLAWLEQALGEVWTDRGAYPGIASVLTYLGMKSAVTLQREVLAAIAKTGDYPWNTTLAWLTAKQELPRGHQSGLLTAAQRWRTEPDSRRELLTFLARADVTASQVERIVHPTKRAKSGMVVSDVDLLSNPYPIPELDRGAGK